MPGSGPPRGRERLSRRTGSTATGPFLAAADVRAAVRLLQAVEAGQEAPDDLDHLANLTVRTVTDVQVLLTSRGRPESKRARTQARITLVLRRPLEVGDKLANRHGAKGVVALVVPEADMPCLADGTPVDLVCNPLGVPSRMNIGQLLEAHLSLAARKLGSEVVCPPIAGPTPEDARALLREAGLPDDGRLPLRDGRNGRLFDQPSTVGFVYWRRLRHMVSDAYQVRSTGGYDPVTQEPLAGRRQHGGQKLGKMEIWALQSHGAAHNLREFLSVKSDDAVGRQRVYDAIVEQRQEAACQTPESARRLLRELRAVGLDVYGQGPAGRLDASTPRRRPPPTRSTASTSPWPHPRRSAPGPRARSASNRPSTHAPGHPRLAACSASASSA